MQVRGTLNLTSCLTPTDLLSLLDDSERPRRPGFWMRLLSLRVRLHVRLHTEVFVNNWSTDAMTMIFSCACGNTTSQSSCGSASCSCST
jgi:hypothetical protein